MPRLGHKKSRNGCRQCKARHVKCDENKPCSSCARHGVPCSLVTWDPETQGFNPDAGSSTAGSAGTAARGSGEWSNSRRASSASIQIIEEYQHSTPASTVQRQGSGSTIGGAESSVGPEESASPASSTDTYPFLTKIVHDKDATEQANWARDLELIHHWTTSACISMCPRDDIRHLWTVYAPKEAIKHTYLLHQILTFSALHFAHHQPEQRPAYHALGIHHQDLAIRAMRTKLANVTPENASFLFATSTLISMCVFGERGLAALTPGGKEPLEDLLDAFALVKGMGGLLYQSYPLVMQSPFAPLITNGTVPVPPQPIFDIILSHVPDTVTFLGAQTDVPEEIQRECLVQLISFRDILLHNSNPLQDSREMRTLFFWPLTLKPEFATWVRERRQPVLVLLAFYAVTLRAGELLKGDGEQIIYWFYKGWAERVMRAVGQSIDPVWQPVIQWAWDFIMGTSTDVQQSSGGLKRQRSTADMDMSV